MEKKWIGMKVVVWLVLFYVFSSITFTVENQIDSAKTMVKNQKFDVRVSASDNSHLGQWILNTGLFTIMPLFFFVLVPLAKKWKLFLNLFFISGIMMVIMFLFEYWVGVLCNIHWKLNLWDYSDMFVMISNFKLPFHLHGQINIFYIPIWYGSAVLLFPLFKLVYSADEKMMIALYNSLSDITHALFKNKGYLHDNYYSDMVKEIKK